MSRIDPNPLAIERSFKEKLKGKGRRRRDGLTRLAAPSAAPRALRNDVLPLLEITYLPLDCLRSPARKVRVRDAAHVREVAASMSALGFCNPVLIGKNNVVLDGEVRLEAARLLGLGRAPCVRIDHLSEDEQRLLRLAVNRLGEKGQWDLDELKIEFEELILADAPIEISGFSPDEIDQIVIGEEPEAVEQGPLAPTPGAVAVAHLGDMFQLGPHRLICGDATDPTVLRRLMEGDPGARVVLTDEPYNVPIAGHVTGGAHREFAMASGEMSDEQFLGFNAAWIEAALPHLCDGGVFGTFIDWRGAPTVVAAAAKLGLTPLNLIVWAKTNAGMGSLYRSQHELLPLFKKGDAPHVNNVELGKRGRWRSNVWTYPGASSLGSDARRGLQDHPTVKPTVMLEDALLDLTHRGDIVLDPFLGSGSTLIAADKAGRVCRGVEFDPLYVDVIIRRYEAATGEAAALVDTGESFRDLAARRAGDLGCREQCPDAGV
ncbi:MAG: site-specific DNA-methyltransferase [Roseiarcus sp.]